MGTETVNRLKLKKLKSRLFPDKVQCYEHDMHDIGMQTIGLGLNDSKTQHQRHTQQQRKQQQQQQFCEPRDVHNTKSADDTYSYTSCSLKKMITSESPKIMLSLILVVGTLSVILLLKFICFPATISEVPETKEVRGRRSDDAVTDANVDSKPWETSNSKLKSEFSDLTGKDVGETKLHEGGEEYPDYLSSDLSSILDPIKVNEGYGSNKLRDFYRKLLKTDIQIKNLKKGFASIKRGNIDLSDPSPPRLKRSSKVATTTEKRELFNRVNHETRKWQMIKQVGKNSKEHAEDTSSVNTGIDKVKIIIKEDKSKQPKKIEQLFSNFEDWLHNIFRSETYLTPNRRLLQRNYDEDDNDGATEDYEELTKEPWEREKRTVSPMEVFIKTDPKPDVESSTMLKNAEMNYLIAAAMKMKKSKTDKSGQRGKYTKDIGHADNMNYNELVAMAQAYSDYGVLDNKKEIFNNNLAPANTFKSITSKKPEKAVKWPFKNVDNPHGQRVKLKSGDELKTVKPTFFKMLRQTILPKIFHLQIKNNDIGSTSAKMLSNIDVAKILNSTRIMSSTASWTKSNQKTTQKHKERNLLFSGHRRSLKSVATDEINYEATATDNDIEAEVNNTDKPEGSEVTRVKLNNENKNRHSETDNKKITSANHKDKSLNVSENISKHGSSNTTSGLGDIFSMIADFCMFMAGVDTNQENSISRFPYDFMTMQNQNSSQGNLSSPEKEINDSRGTDSKISHRSRRLLSFEEPIRTTDNITISTSSERNINESYVITNKNSNTTIVTNKANSTSNIDSKTITEGNRTVVKRSADGDSIFWNDMYDDEYGIKDPMEDDMKDKSVVKINDLLGKDNWINTKFRKIAKSFKERRNRKLAKKNRNLLVEDSRNEATNHTKRSVPETNDSSKRMFESLTANVKKVCQEAAKAVQDTTNRQVRADSDQSSTLMQQLIGLMSDLVDLQVREKTCVQLPDDLRSFLAWLTSPNSEEQSETGFTVSTYNADPGSDLHTFDDIAPSNARSECLGTIHDVEDLILQYDEMSEEDKSKMSGVREYLEHQLHYLHQQLSTFNEYGSLLFYQDQPIRKRRQPKTSFKKRKAKNYKFLSYYNKKHTKHTDFDDTTEDYRTKLNKVRNYKHNGNVKVHQNEHNRLLMDIVDTIDNVNEDRIKRNAESDTKKVNNYLSGLVNNNNSNNKIK